MKLTESQLRVYIRHEIRNRVIEEGAMDWLQGGLDIVGLVPGIGEAADALNAVISLARDNPVEAILSGISMIPGAGDIVGKGGKIVKKTFDPVMDMIKNGDAVADIVKKIGPETIEKVKKPIEMVKDTVVKYQPQLKDAIEAVKNADLEAIEKLIGIEIPGLARGKAEELLEKASKEINVDGLGKIFDFLSNLDLSGEAEEEQAGEKLAASYNPRGYLLTNNPTLLGHVLGSDYINEQLKIFAEQMRKLI